MNIDLKKRKKFSFYGDVDFMPTEEYSKEDAVKALKDAEFIVSIAEIIIK